jgi:orotidine-5'-phosphate decarboxylase
VAASQLVVALDVSEIGAARALVADLTPLGVSFKIGYEAYYAFGATLLAEFARAGAPFVLDLKLHDIPRTVAAAMHALVRPGLRIVTVHALGGAEMLRAAVDGARRRASALEIPAPEIFAVTILTSLSADDVEQIGVNGSPEENVMRLAGLAREAGCAGVVCSPSELKTLKAFFGRDLAAFCPGIRPAGSAAGDQKRVATPASALRDGADFLVVGRPITEAPDPAAATRNILAEMQSVVVK